MKIIFRDDDPCGWTDTNDLIEKYETLFSLGIKVSVGVIPFAIKSINSGDPDSFYQIEHSEKPIGMNRDLVDYLKTCRKNNNVEIMLHGYNHSYFLDTLSDMKCLATKCNIEKYRNTYSKAPRFLGEYVTLQYCELNRRTCEGKIYLEDLFHSNIQVFVPPSNQITSAGLRAIINNGLNLSGLIGRKYDRQVSVRGLFSYLSRWMHRLKGIGVAYPHVIDYVSHMELASNGIGSSRDRVALLMGLAWLKSKNASLCINTHYWEIDPDIMNFIKELSLECAAIGFEPATISEVIRR